MAYCYNPSGCRGELPERSLEPPEKGWWFAGCWYSDDGGPAEPYEEEYYKREGEHESV